MFEAGDFDKLFYQNRRLRKAYEAWRDGRKTQSTTELEAQIDLLVYRLYGRSWAEVKLVDPAFGMSEAEYWAVEV